MTKWIPLSDELPTMGEYVLVWLGDRPWHDECPKRFAVVMKRRPCQVDDNHVKPWKWESFGASTAFPYEPHFWAPIEHPDDY